MRMCKNLFDLWYRPVRSPVVIRTLEGITESEKEEFENNLSRLVQNFGSELWALSGGVAAQINTGSIYRKSPNFNLSLPVENLYDIAKLAESNEYLLLSRGWQVRYKENIKREDEEKKLAWEEEIEVRHETYEKVEFINKKLKKPYSNIRFVKIRANNEYFKNPDMLDFIDVHPFVIESYRPESFPEYNTDTLLSLDKDEKELTIPKRFLDNDITYATSTGVAVKVRGPEYMDCVLRWFIMRVGKKSKNRRMISWYDLGKLYQSLERDFSAFCANYVYSKNVDLRKLPVITGIRLDEMAHLWGEEKGEFHRVLKEYILRQKKAKSRKAELLESKAPRQTLLRNDTSQ